MEALLKPLQNDATSGTGKTLTVPDPARMVQFLIRVKGTPMGGEITFECCPMGAAPYLSSGIAWRVMKTLPVPTDIFAVAEYYAGKVSGMFRARISTSYRWRWHSDRMALRWCANRKHQSGIGAGRPLTALRLEEQKRNAVA